MQSIYHTCRLGKDFQTNLRLRLMRIMQRKNDDGPHSKLKAIEIPQVCWLFKYRLNRRVCSSNIRTILASCLKKLGLVILSSGGATTLRFKTNNKPSSWGLNNCGPLPSSYCPSLWACSGIQINATCSSRPDDTTRMRCHTISSVRAPACFTTVPSAQYGT